jgi:DNA-binding transcriptional MerR regulator
MKAPDAFRTISEVAAALDLPQHVLRFWESRFNQVKPMKRGGGRRYYRPEDIDLLRGIRLFLYSEGYTIRGVQRLLKEKGVGFVAEAGRTGRVETVAPGLEADPTPAPPVAPSNEPDGPPPPAAALDGAEERPQPRERTGLGIERRRALESALAELEDAKRLLEQAR